MKRAWVVAVAVVAGLWAASALAQIPQITHIGTEEYVGPAGRLSTIACDRLNQPHIAADGGASLFFYDRIGGGWVTGPTVNMRNYGAGQFYNPHMEIDNNDVAWVSGICVKFFGVATRKNMSTAPGAAVVDKEYLHPRSWDTGNLSVDLFVNETVGWGAGGWWNRWVFNDAASDRARRIDSGNMYCGVGGEANSLWVSKAAPVQHARTGLHSVWHLATGAHAGYGMSFYQNWARYERGLPSVAWANPYRFRGMGTDGCYVKVVGDNKVPEAAYIIVDLAQDSGQGGTYVNVFDGNQMVASIDTMILVDRVGNSGLRRYAPQLAPAKNGGAWMCWQRNGQVKVRYIGIDGRMGTEVDVGPGTLAAIATDSQGNIHLSYNNNGMKYRKLMVAGGGASGLSQTADFDFDGVQDVITFDQASGNWFIRRSSDGQMMTTDFGPDMIPVPGDYNGDGFDDLAVVDPVTFNWYIHDIRNNVHLAWGQNWGYASCIPVPADYNGDGAMDLGVYDPATGFWYMWDLKNQRQISVGRNWGYAGCVPVPGDYTGDGQAELAVYDPVTGWWHIWDMTHDGRETGYQAFQWGAAGFVPVPADYNGDGATDLAVYDSTKGWWYIWNLKDREQIAWEDWWGFQGWIPVRIYADPNNPAKATQAVYDPVRGEWYIKGVTGGTPIQFGDVNHIPLGGCGL